MSDPNTPNTPTDAAQRRKEDAATEAEAKSIDGRAGQPAHTSHDHMSDTKAGSTEGAGGGAKQKQKR